MQHNFYKELYIKESYGVYEFFSIGKKGAILKRIEFKVTDYENVYSLRFGDVNLDGELDDLIISDNGDKDKVIVTVIQVISTYLEYYPDRFVYFSGSTKERTRLYRIIISTNYADFTKKFNVFSQTDTGMIPFQKNIEAKGFLIHRKN